MFRLLALTLAGWAVPLGFLAPAPASGQGTVITLQGEPVALATATRIASHAIHFEFPREGTPVPHGRHVLLRIPTGFADRIVDHVVFRHRKRPEVAGDAASGWDENSPFLEVAFHDPDRRRWHRWADQFGSGKRSAVRPADHPKRNTLTDCPGLVGTFSPDLAAVQNVGTPPEPARAEAALHGIELHFVPPPEEMRRADRVWTEPVAATSVSLQFVIDAEQGMPLFPGQRWHFCIPASWSRRVLYHAILKHRKEPALGPATGTWDPEGAYVLLRAHDSGTGLWRTWADRSGSAKFSEIRPADNPEAETLHNCLKVMGKPRPDRITLENVSPPEHRRAVSRIHALELVFLPEDEGAVRLERIYTPETAFFDLPKGILVPLLGGGPRLQGRFPGAVVLGAGRRERLSALQSLPKEHRFETAATTGDNCHLDEAGRLHITLPPGKRLVFLELAVGDLDVTSLSTNKDGYFGRPGAAAIDAWVQHPAAPEHRRWLVRGNNVGMACLIAGGPKPGEGRCGPGDELIIDSRGDCAFLMGWRLTFLD